MSRPSWSFGKSSSSGRSSPAQRIVARRIFIEYVDPASTVGGQLTREEAFFTNQKLGEIRSLPRGAAWELMDVPDNAYADGRIADEGIKKLRANDKMPITWS